MTTLFACKINGENVYWLNKLLLISKVRIMKFQRFKFCNVFAFLVQEVGVTTSLHPHTIDVPLMANALIFQFRSEETSLIRD